MFFASDTVIQYNKLGFRIGMSVELVLGLEECYRYSTSVVFLTAIMHFSVSVSCLFPGFNAPMQSSFYFVLLLLLL